MPESMSEYLHQDMQCEGLLECFHGLKELDRSVFGVLVSADEPLTVDEVAERVDRERTTAYRSIQRLRDAGFVDREQVNYDSGGYYHVFQPVGADEIADDMQRLLNDWYAKMGQLIHEFRDKYDEPDRTQTPPTTE
ncbi:helix-turn-helix domain-containing protein [Halomarina rubra]|uniref:Helix-turn-helix domain-containing protein n=1 Tax=Halomarina rubra TaxID=2071873 RepID=A0ABD6AXN3_9EURY|nr:helix-turn-helix domain-containing protein [Halomarina rubra]